MSSVEGHLRPVVFVGSSREGLDVAGAIQLNLDHDAEVILWSQGVFGLSEGTLESLVGSCKKFDFAVLVLTPDDLILRDEQGLPSPRDNVVFELGLFMGTLGRERCFIVYDRTKQLKLPSDFAGVTAATFQPPKSGSLQSALGAPSTQILGVIRRLGPVGRVPADVYIDQRTQFGIISDLLEPAAHQFFIAMYEQNAALQREGPYGLGPRYEYRLKRPKGHQDGQGTLQVDSLCARLADAGILVADLRGRVTLSERGRSFAEWLTGSGFKAEYFWSELGVWGKRPDTMSLCGQGGAAAPAGHGAELPPMQQNILFVLSNGMMTAGEIAHYANIVNTVAEYHLDKLEAAGMVSSEEVTYGNPPGWELTPKGRDYLVEHGLVG